MLINTDFCKESLVPRDTRVLYLGGLLITPSKHDLVSICDLRVSNNRVMLFADRFPQVYATPVFMEQHGGSLKFGMLSVLMSEGVPDHREPKFSYLPLFHAFLVRMSVEDCARYVAGVDLEAMAKATVLYEGVETPLDFDILSIRVFGDIIVKTVSSLKLNGTLDRYKLYEA